MEVFHTSNDDNEIQSKINWADCEFNEADINDNPEVKDSFDLRHKISQHSPNGEKNGKESPSRRQRLREHDLRLKLSRNRQEQMDHSSNDGRRRHEGAERGRRRRGESGRARYTERVAGLSPLRSPRAATLHNILDLDNSRNHRFTDHLQDGNGSSPNGATQRRIRSNQRTPYHDDEKYPGMTTTVLSDCEDSEETNSWTPDYSRKTRRLDKTSWTRRRLELPAESTEQDSDGESRLPTISEENRVRMARREKDIAYGKNTDAYRMYIELIPRELRSQNGKKHPRTPKKDKECSRRSWDAQVKLWKRRIHAWANEEGTFQESARSGNDSPQEGNSWASIVANGRFHEVKHETKEHINGEDLDGAMDGSNHDNGNAEGDDEEAEGEKEESEDEEADAFLDSADIDFTVAHQVQEQVRLDDA